MLNSIYPIIDLKRDQELNVEYASRVLKLYPEFLQIRMKESGVNEIVSVTRELLTLRDLISSGTQIIVNDSIEAAVFSGSDGVHVGQEDDISLAMEHKSLKFKVGFSTHTLEEVINANRIDIDYIGFGPVFKTDTKKQSYSEVFEIVGETVRISKHRIVFIGGINKRNIESLPSGNNIMYAMISSVSEFF